MSLLEQFQTIIGSIVFGSLSLFTWTLFNRVFYSKKVLILRIPLEIALFCYMAYLYYVFLGSYGSGVFNIFYVPALCLGGYIYYRFYAYHFETLFEGVANSLEKAILNPIKLKKKKIHDKLLEKEKKRKIRHEEKIKQKRQQSH